MPKYELVVTIFSPVQQLVMIEAPSPGEAIDYVHATLKEHNINHFPFIQCNEITEH